ncbi:hypothetical protein P3T76_008221 [Phytophthora citrophthora]|uniref:Uncharacterized protein n=1 Tax=Phytophthora citrophthora TaxID=4793 RepID=A0AAD9GKI0_9STRA|nr:hypothetical protein P3T76_008221 [Phytophthora citrophthora]
MAGATAVTLDEDGHPQGFDEINSTFWIQNDEYFGKNFQPEEGQIHVLVVLPELHQGASLHEGGARFSMTDKEEYERMVIEDSYAKYLSAIAETVAYFYKFECEFETFPTIDDVFYALKDGGWEFRLEEGNPLTAVELPKFFTEDEWNELKEMNDVLHDGKVFTKSTGKPFIVLPHDLYDEDLVAALKKMVMTTNIVSDATEFEVYDENEF